VYNIKVKYGIFDDDMYNFDEIGFMMGIIIVIIIVTALDGRSKAK